MDKHLPLYNLFVKYLEDKCSPDEIRQLLLYFDDAESEYVLRSLIKAELGFVNKDEDIEQKTDAAVNKVKSMIIKEITYRNNQELKHNSKRKFVLQNWMKIAALWLVLITSVFLLVSRHIGNNDKRQSMKFASTKPGERKLLQLYDGTKVWLSPSSSLEYQDQLIGNLREVKLEGEAFFEVTKDKKHPFIIHSGRMQTEVVGTSFNVNSYSKQNIYNVTVVTGIVKVSMMSDKKEKLSEVILKPKQQAIFNNAQSTLADKLITSVDAVIKKKDGILSYEGTPVPEVVSDLKRYYNQSIELENKSAACLCYGEFDTKKPIGIVLSQLAGAIGATVRETDKGYFLEGGCNDK
jgi:transmembrane sensor